MTQACEFRKKDALLTVEDKSGYYKWWAKRPELEENTHQLAAFSKCKLSQLLTQSKKLGREGK